MSNISAISHYSPKTFVERAKFIENSILTSNLLLVAVYYFTFSIAILIAKADKILAMIHF